MITLCEILALALMCHMIPNGVHYIYGAYHIDVALSIRKSCLWRTLRIQFSAIRLTGIKQYSLKIFYLCIHIKLVGNQKKKKLRNIFFTVYFGHDFGFLKISQNVASATT